METQARYITVGSFVLLFAAGIVAFAMWMSRVDLEVGHPYYIYFKGSVSGLRSNETVTYKGIPIGNVLNIDIDPEKLGLVRVKIGIDTPTLIRENSYATLEVKGLTGNVDIQIKGSTRDSPVLIRKGLQRHPVIPSQRSGINALLMQAPNVLAKVVSLIDKMEPVFSAKNVKAFDETMQNVSKFTGALADESGDMKGLFAATKKAFKTIDNRVDKAGKSLESAMDELDKLIAENRPQIEIGLYELSQLMNRLSKMAGTIDRVAQNIERSPLGFLLESDKQAGHKIEG